MYIGGDNEACSSPDASWVSTINGQGWSIAPLWVGLQSACSGYANTFPTGPESTDYSDGKSSAENAISAAESLGFASGSIVYYDLEGFGAQSNSGCATAAINYIDGWTDELHSHGWSAGVYGSSCDSGIKNYSGVDDIWPADWNTTDSVWGLSCIVAGTWEDDLRLHQYDHNVYHGWGGTSTYKVDEDCAFGQVAGTTFNENYHETVDENNGSTEDAACP